MVKSAFKIRGFMMDLARQIERPDQVLAAARGMNAHGYNLCMVYLEDAYAFPRHPKLSRPHAYTPEFMRELHGICAAQGMELVPVFPSLGHGAYITDKEGYGHLDEGRGTERNYGTLSPSFPETYGLLEELYEDWCRYIPGQYLHVGLDESPAMGQYLRRTQGAADFDAPRMFADHGNRLNRILKRLGRRMIMWGDMFYYFPQAINRVDKDIVVAEWYYYAFPRTPRVELYNFQDLDSVRRLKDAGFAVWGVPSVWPNYPFADVADRWRNLQDWLRYGEECGIEGIVNTDWENTFGFYANTDLMFRALGDNLLCGGPIRQTFGKTLSQLLGTEVPDSWVDDLFKLGQFHLTGHGNRAMHLRDPVSLTSFARQAECRRNYAALKEMFRDLPTVQAACVTERGRNLLESLDLSWRMVTLTWRLAAQLPDVYATLSVNYERHARAILIDLQKAIGDFTTAYEAYWEKVRFPDDLRPVREWAKKTERTLQEWIDASREDYRGSHPLPATPRLDYTLRCRYPALGVLNTSICWKDAAVQKETDILIRFESHHAQPESPWVQHSSHVLSRPELPERLCLEVGHYGQVGIESVKVVWNGREYHYEVDRFHGTHAVREQATLWLGPRAGSPGLPTHREEKDIGEYVRRT